jgi:hypothetical protein
MNGNMRIQFEDGSIWRGTVRNWRQIQEPVPPVEPPDPPPDPPVDPPVGDRMLLGANSPQYWGDCTERGRLRSDGTLDPQFLTDQEPFVLQRYMETTTTNGSPVVNVGDAPQHPGWGFDEVARHAKAAGRRPWVNVPHKATDTFIEWMAELFVDGPAPLVEYSNELANTNFSQSRWAADQWGAWSTVQQQRENALHFAAQRTQRIAQVWRAVDPRVVTIFTGTNAADIETSACDVVSSVAYLGIESAWPMYQEVRGYNVQQLCGWLTDDSLPRLAATVARDVAAAGDKPLYLYEAGQHVKGDVVSSSIAAQGSEEMGQVYRAFLQAMDAAGVALFCNYQGPHVWSGYHTFGVMPATGQWTPKYRALREWAGV